MTADGIIDDDEKVTSKKIPNLRLELENHTQYLGPKWPKAEKYL